MTVRSKEEARSRLEAIIDTALFAIITINDEGVVEDFNPSAETMFGYTGAEVIGQNVSVLMPEPYRGEHDGYIRRYLTTGSKRIIGIGREVVALRKDGSTFPVHLSVSEVKLADRTLFTGMIEDITARRQAEDRVTELQNELIHVARLSAMGELASALAHELNQPLTAVSNYANAARRMLDNSGSKDPHTASELLLKASDQALRAGEIIRRLRQFI
ncbi:MAG: PAS domain S-box protein, partial [Methyloligellaceae bacterium]